MVASYRCLRLAWFCGKNMTVIAFLFGWINEDDDDDDDDDDYDYY